MLRKCLFVFVFVLSFSLFGCDSNSNEKTLSNAKKESNTTVDKPKSKNFGSFKKNETSLPINAFFAIWVEDRNVLKIIQTPTSLTEDEKKRLEGGESDFFVLNSKETPNKELWQWYPYIVTELRFKSDEIKSDNLRNFYIKSYGIEEANFTDNINSNPSGDNVFKKINYVNNKLVIEYSGQYKILEDKYSWSIKLK